MKGNRPPSRDRDRLYAALDADKKTAALRSTSPLPPPRERKPFALLPMGDLDSAKLETVATGDSGDRLSNLEKRLMKAEQQNRVLMQDNTRLQHDFEIRMKQAEEKIAQEYQSRTSLEDTLRTQQRGVQAVTQQVCIILCSVTVSLVIWRVMLRRMTHVWMSSTLQLIRGPQLRSS